MDEDMISLLIRIGVIMGQANPEMESEILVDRILDHWGEMMNVRGD